jgi:hypothetical protein
MTEAVIVTNEELAILCDIVGGWSSKLAGNADTDKQHALDRLIANGFVELANGHSVTKYQHTAHVCRFLEPVRIRSTLAR